MKKLFLIVLLVIAVFAALASRQPADFTISRSTVIAAEPSKIFLHINNLHAWEAWSPWAKLDPKATNSYEGPEHGAGAIMRWAGNMQVGAGSMTITESKPNTSIAMTLDMTKPMAASNHVTFTLAPEGKGTLVTWSMSGTRNFIAKAMSLVFNCDTMVGGKFEEGLASLKTVVEAK